MTKAKYPTVPFAARDVLTLLQTIEEHSSAVNVWCRPAPTLQHPERWVVAVACFRKTMLDGLPVRVEGVKYVDARGLCDFDRAIFDAAWQVINELDAPQALWGRYTSLVDLPPSK